MRAWSRLAGKAEKRLTAEGAEKGRRGR